MKKDVNALRWFKGNEGGYIILNEPTSNAIDVFRQLICGEFNVATTLNDARKLIERKN